MPGRRDAPVAAVVVVGAALLPLLHEQLRGDHAENVTGGVGLATRTKGVVTSWIVGERGAAIGNGLEWLGGALLMAGVVLLRSAGRREALMPAVVGGGGAALMLLAALCGADYINNRNTIPVLAIVLARPRDRLRGGAGSGWRWAARPASCSGRDDRRADRSRARARGLAERGARRSPAPAVVVTPAFTSIPLRWYTPELGQVPTATSASSTSWSPIPTATRCRPARSTRRPRPASGAPARRPRTAS